MAWISPITDRAQSDIANRTSKGFFNVADWARIDGNTAEVQAVIASLLGLTVNLDDVDAPVITQFPTVTEINALIANIEAVRAGACLPVGVGLTVLKTDWQPGSGAPAPNYETVNDWERNLLLLYTLLPYAADYAVRCGVAAVGQPRFWQARFRG